MMNNNWESLERLHLNGANGRAGSVMLVTMGTLAVLMLAVAVTIMSTTNKYFTAYQWSSWQEALQGAESGADIAMAEMRKEIDNDTTTVPWIGWNLGTYSTDNSY